MLYPAELRARRVLAIGFAAYWQAPAAAAGRQGLRQTAVVAAGIAAGIAGRWPAIFPGLGLGAKNLTKSIDQKSDDNKEAEPAENSRRKHGRKSLTQRAGAAVRAQLDGAVGDGEAQGRADG
ncbi:MAG TPA: hypothetical protein VK749_05085, partial [Xanthobacteraceae bacterium]|nr:hypothetical protein [Xanthobacteraceae bacterium]